MLKYQTPHNRHILRGEFNNQPSMTIPDKTMTMREILKRHKLGLPIAGQKVGFYEDEGEMSQQEFQRLDLAEQQEIIESRRRELEEIKAQANKKALELKERQAAQHAAKVAKAREEASKRLQGPEKPTSGTDESTNLS